MLASFDEKSDLAGLHPFLGVARIGLQSLVNYYKHARFDESLNNLTPASSDTDRRVPRSVQEDTHHETRNQTANAPERRRLHYQQELA
jgi:hypothetical protein